MVFLVILPPLLFSSAWAMSQRAFRFNLGEHCVAGGGTGGVYGVGSGGVCRPVYSGAGVEGRIFAGGRGVAHGCDRCDFDCDEAGTAARGALRMCSRGESLVNDATGLLALELGVMMILDVHTPTVGEGDIAIAVVGRRWDGDRAGGGSGGCMDGELGG